MLKTVLECDRCSATKNINGQINPDQLNSGFEGWFRVRGKTLCQDCVKSVDEFVNRRAPRQIDSGFTDGRPVGK